jgi:pyruvate carboxylase subunit B
MSSRKPVKITDTTLRDGHQSLFATRMRTEDMIPIAEKIEEMGYHSVEMWGGATFDVMHRFLAEDPWERIRTLKKYMPTTPFQMLLRGQNLVGYRNYPDDVVEAFVSQACDVGIDIFRVFDSVNDERNFETSFKVIKAHGKHIQGTVCYSLTERKLGGPIYNIDYFVNKALKIQEMGADSICVKDQAGLIAPYDAYELIKALKVKLDVPVQLHTHFTSGMGALSLMKAVEAGVDVIDLATAPFGMRTSEPAIEPFIVTFQGTERDPGLDLNKVFEIGKYLETIIPKYKRFADQTRFSVIDTSVLLHQIPGGMTTNLVSQLKQAKALHRLSEVHKEIAIVRKELGSPPLVTPSSQLVGAQAVMNVLFGRYKMITNQTKDYVYGLYGKPPVAIDQKIQKLALKGYPRGETPITCRAADLLKPELDKAREATQDVAKSIEDVLIYALFPNTGLSFLKWKYGMEPIPESVKPVSLEAVEEEENLVQLAREGKLIKKEDCPK